MSINELIRNAILPIVHVCVPEPYDGEDAEYCTFVYTIIPWTYADGKPTSFNYSTQLHWFLPAGVNPFRKMKEISESLQASGFPCPEIINASDEVGQHYVFEFSYISYESDVTVDGRKNPDF